MFHNCKTLEEMKTLYRKLALRLHPDHGGEHIHMILLRESYELATAFFESKTKEIPKSKKQKYEKTYDLVYQNDEELNIINEILEYSKTHPKFCLNYITSVRDFLDENGYITCSQYNSLVNIYYSFRMDKKS